MSISVDTRETLQRYAGGIIELRCCFCPHSVEMPAEDLAQLIGGMDVVIERSRRIRMKCTKCDHRGPALIVSFDKKPRNYSMGGMRR